MTMTAARCAARSQAQRVYSGRVRRQWRRKCKRREGAVEERQW